MPADPLFVVGPAGIDRGVAVRDGDEVIDGGDRGADRVDEVGELGVDEDDFGLGVLEDVLEVGGDQAVVDWDDHGADGGGGVEGFEELVAVGGDDRDAVALAEAHCDEGVGLLVDALAELAPGETELAVDDGLGVGEELGRAAQKIVDEQRDFHGEPPRNAAIIARRGLWDGDDGHVALGGRAAGEHEVDGVVGVDQPLAELDAGGERVLEPLIDGGGVVLQAEGEG